MRLAKILALLGFLVMLGTLTYGFVIGDFSAEGTILLSMPWGRVSLIDVYVGFFLFSAWIVYREQSILRSALWVILVIVLGNMMACLYVLLALQRSQGDWEQFWLGRRAGAYRGTSGPSARRPKPRGR
jgi:hypothetical protein